ncbi:hypothetical protein [Bacteroides caccae]|jgi:hypothetical protein|uniref:hypothetical protein n=1 Tax=Bacteroides caccae TaxID=47678 RepID=UPI0015BA6EB4|nr:hypothetical protein [Bacteroides caccae]
MKRLFLFLLILSCIPINYAQQRWKINTDGGITWQVKKGDVHHDHIEMAGKQIAVVLRYGVDKTGAFELNKSMIWPMLRTIPNNTHGSLMRRFDWNPLDAMTINGRSIEEQVRTITLNGTMEVISDITLGKKNSLSLKRTYLPSTESPSLIEMYEFTNTGTSEVSLEIPTGITTLSTNPKQGVAGSYSIKLLTHGTERAVTLLPDKSYTFSASISGYKPSEKEAVIDANQELLKRQALVSEWMSNLILETPDPILDKMFAFSKIRSCESIYATKGGPMHGPGGESYYAAIWANDQAEYINPYFPFIGYDYGNASAVNSFKHFARYMNNEWKPIPSSIIAEGESYWNGAGDRGDAAMIAYGAARYALASGNKEEARQLWPLIEWCLEFNHKKLNEAGVVTSDADELEGRFPAGKANLCTSSLYYDALLSAAYLAEDLDKGAAVIKKYRQQASDLEKAIDSYFAATVEGFDTYAYYEGNDILRAWICIPLTVGINKRATGTIDALFSPRLWSENGLLTQAGSQTFWDRSTLYALRGAFMAGEIEKAMKFMKHYSGTRLLGNHVPYPVEAWPEGGQRHLSAESGLYGRIITEGIFGIRPTGLHSFTLTPRLPQEWGYMYLRKIKAFDSDFDIEVIRKPNNKLQVTVKKEGNTILNKQVKNGTTIKCKI